LIAQAFATASGHQNQRVVAAADMLDDVALRPSKRLIAKDLTEDAQNRG
jgi:hypothetical protein